MKIAKHLFLLALMGAVAIGCSPATDEGGEGTATGVVEETPAEPVDVAEPPAEEASEEAAEEEAMQPEADAGEVMEEAAEGVAEVAEEADDEMTGSDQEAVQAIVADWKEGMLALDVDKATAAYSEAYEDAQAGSKEEAVEWIKGIMEQGFLEGIEVGEEDMEVEIDGSEAIVGPFDVTSDAGAWTIDMYLEKEDGGWKIVSLDVY